jgi:hypothetical protein
MTTLNRSAEIIAFPPRGRFAAPQPHDIDDAPVAKAVSFGSWYHEEAIRDERTKSN